MELKMSFIRYSLYVPINQNATTQVWSFKTVLTILYNQIDGCTTLDSLVFTIRE